VCRRSAASPRSWRYGLTVSILKQSHHVVASIQSDLTDAEVIELRDALLVEVVRHRARAVIVDVSALDVIDSLVSRALTAVAMSNRMHGARTVVVGIRPEVAVAMSRFGLRFDAVTTALDVDAGVELVRTATLGGSPPGPASRDRMRRSR
jgi:rsbT antagonist protein RsbS